MIDLNTPQARVAQDFMRHKGLANYTPDSVQKIEDWPCWYFHYDLPESGGGGHLELEVYYDSDALEWQCTVTTFTKQRAI